MTNHARAAEIAFVGQVEVAARADGATKTGGNFVIAEIDVRAATGTISRCRRVADFVFAFALETGNNAIALTAPYPFKFSMKRTLFGGE
jgi:hypothetical protein